MRSPQIASLFALSITVAACATTSAVSAPEPSGPTARFYHVATGCAPASSMKLTLAIVAPAWQQKAPTIPTPPPPPTSASAAPTVGGNAALNAKFRAALRDDFLEIVACRGYLSKGPFDSFDAMVYPDREGSNLLLEPIIESSAAFVDITKAARCKGFLGKASCTMDAVSGTTPLSYTVNGAIQLGGRVTLTLREPVTNTRMWTKSVEMPSERVVFTGEGVYSASATIAPDLWADRGVQVVLVPALERAYASVLTAADGYLNARELQLVATQAADVRRKASISVPR